MVSPASKYTKFHLYFYNFLKQPQQPLSQQAKEGIDEDENDETVSFGSFTRQIKVCAEF